MILQLDSNVGFTAPLIYNRNGTLCAQSFYERKTWSRLR